MSQNSDDIGEGDPNKNYYLLKITGQQPELSDNTEQDDHGTVRPGGCKVLQGHFFVGENLLDMTYQLDDKKAAFTSPCENHSVYLFCLESFEKEGKE